MDKVTRREVIGALMAGGVGAAGVAAANSAEAMPDESNQQPAPHERSTAITAEGNMLYGPQTKLAIENFPISGQRLPAELIHALGHVKWSAARVNKDLGRFAQPGPLCLSDQQVEALAAACREVAEGKLDDQFPVDVFQTGSGTSSNMNANEVIANRAIELGGDRFAGDQADPSERPREHGPKHQRHLPHGHPRGGGRRDPPEVDSRSLELSAGAGREGSRWHDVLKIGRTHLADATPLTLGQEIGGLARQVELATERARRAVAAVCELPVGGTAVGTGINTHPEFGRRVADAR